MKLFRTVDDISIKKLGMMQRYQELLDNINLPLHPFQGDLCWTEGRINYDVSKIGKSHWKEYGIFALVAGSSDPCAKLLVLSGHHGEETAGPMAAVHIMNELLDPSPELSDLLRYIQVGVVPCIEPEGYDWDVKRFVQNNRSGYWTSRHNISEDINGSWGCKYQDRRPPEINAVEAFMKEFLDTDMKKYVIDCHETVVSNEEMVVPATLRGSSSMSGAGPVLIESCCDDGVGDAMIRQLVGYGMNPFPYNRKTRLFEKMSLIPQVEMFAPGRSRIGPLIREAKALVCTDYAHKIFGADGITIETFLKPLDERVAEHMILVEGALVYLAEKYSM